MPNHLWRPRRLAGWLAGAAAVSLVVLAAGCTKSSPVAEGAKAPKYEVADEEEDQAAEPATPSPRKTLPPIAPDLAGATVGQPAADNQMPPGRAGAPAADDGQPATDALKQPPSIPSDQLDSLTVPQGSPEELMKFISQMGNRLQTQMQQGNVRPAAMQPVLEAMLEASNKVLTGQIDDAMRKQAIDAKAGALLMLSQVAPNRPWGDQIREFATSLTADKNPAIAIEGRTILLGMLIGEITQGRNQDVAGLMTQAKAMLADEQRNASVLSVTQQAFMALRRIGREDEARELFGLIANAFKDNPDPRLATEADSMLEQILVMDLQIDAKLNDVVLKRDNAVAVFTDAVTQVFQRPNPGSIALERIGGCLPRLEQSGNYELAAKVCELIQAAYKNNTSPLVRDFAKQKTDITLRRLNLLGKPLSVEGTLPDGAPFDFASYQGKSVLLVFWAAALPACRSELLSVKETYEKYQAQGFEVVGVCLDQDKTTMKEFLNDTKLPWTNITNDKLAEQFGVEIELMPYLLLTDRQGNVADLYVAASALDAKLAAMLGPAPPAAPAAPATPVNQLREPAGNEAK